MYPAKNIQRKHSRRNNILHVVLLNLSLINAEIEVNFASEIRQSLYSKKKLNLRFCFHDQQNNDMAPTMQCMVLWDSENIEHTETYKFAR